jgi:hypothetical protein
MMRQRLTTIRAIAGCFACNGSEAIWTASNAMAVAARHHDTTGHETWADQTLTVRYVASNASGIGSDDA